MGYFLVCSENPIDKGQNQPTAIGVGTQLCVQWCTESVDAGHNCRKLTILQTMLQTWMLSGLYLWNEMKSQLTKAITSQQPLAWVHHPLPSGAQN